MDNRTKVLAQLCAFCAMFLLNAEAANIDVMLTPSGNDGIKLVSISGNDQKLLGTIGIGKDFSNIACLGESFCKMDSSSIELSAVRDGFKVKWESNDTAVEFKDCFDLSSGGNWYGGPERYNQSWPLEKMTINGTLPYVLIYTDNFAVAERYWLNSKGAYIFIHDEAPLFVDQNNEKDGQVCFISKVQEPYVNRKRNILEYTIVIKNDPKEAHLHAVNNYLGKPTGHPDERMIREPIWTTWAKYKKPINDSVVIDFAQDILDHGFEKGQIEIDDDWEKCYGAQEFKSDKFANIAETVKKLKEKNFRVTLWIHPFVNSNCQNNSNEGVDKGYFVKNTKGIINGSWWDGDQAHQIDFTNPEAAEWFSARLRKLQQNPGIDSFKFDAGETNYGPQPSVYANEDIERVPNILSERYVRTCAKFGDLIEVRSASRTQDLPIFVRMLDKDSHWGVNNGLYTLITTLLQMNLNGYTMVLPDMIGGNGYDLLPSAELIVRWTQANVFMPSMQFSYLPWEITSNDFNAVEIVRRCVNLHASYSDAIIRAMEASIQDGTPVNPPIWWVDPTDPIALACDDEFLLGENILVAPVITEGAISRNIYLPKGNWKDGNNETIIQGPKNLTNYPAPIAVLPYFIKQ